LSNTITAGTPFNLAITVVDLYGNVVPTYTGSVKFTEPVAGATLPANYTFTTGSGKDNGVHTFTGLVRHPDVINDQPRLIADSFVVPDEALALVPGPLCHPA
jgi:hypothetical protein